MDFENSFNDFGEVSVEVTPHIKALKTALTIVISIIGIIGAVIYFSVKDFAIWQTYPLVLPLILIISVTALFNLATKYFAFLNSFPERNSIVFSHEAIRVPQFFFNPITYIRQSNRSPVSLARNDIRNISYVLRGKGRVPYMKIDYLQEGRRKKLYILRKLFEADMESVNAYLRMHYLDRFEKPDIAASLHKPVKWLVLMVIAGIFAAQAVPLLERLHSGEWKLNKIYDEEDPTDQQKREAMSWASSSSPVIISLQGPINYKIERWPNGRIKSREPIANGQINGVGEYWHDNGQIYGRIPYLNGQKHGKFILYSKNGAKDQELRYKNGRLHGVSEWFIQKEKWLYIDGKAVERLYD